MAGRGPLSRSWAAARSPRGRVGLPADMPQRDKPIRIQWSLLNYGYQPRLTAAWLGGLRAFRQESDLAMIHYESMFWVVTRSLRCFY